MSFTARKPVYSEIATHAWEALSAATAERNPLLVANLALVAKAYTDLADGKRRPEAAYWFVLPGTDEDLGSFVPLSTAVAWGINLADAVLNCKFREQVAPRR